MKHLILKDIISHINASIIKGNKDLVIKKVVTKPNKIKDNTLLFYFDNKKLDLKSHQFNRSNVIVTDKPDNVLKHTGNPTIVKVADINQAYWDFVQYYRGLFQIPVIGVTGTCGKTTTTEMIKTILSKKYNTHSTWDGNNAFYLSLPYILGINSKTEAAVFEMGVGKPGDLKYMCKHYRPQVGVLLNIGTYHLQGCGTLEKYIGAKAELLEGLGFNGTLILNSDDKNSSKIDLSRFKGNIIYFGIKNRAHFTAKNVKYKNQGMKFVLENKDKSYPVYVPGYGEHNVYNALAAIAATCSIGIEINNSIEWLASFKPVRQHMQMRPGINGCTIIDDTWNCTPLSMESAIEVLKSLGKSKTTVAVFGYMPRLGAAGNLEYYRIGEKVAKAGIDFIITIGDDARKIGRKCITTGMDKNKVFFCTSAAELYQALLPLTGQDTVILFKFPYKYRLSKDPSFVEFMGKFCK